MVFSMDNMHVRLNFNLSKEKGIKHHMQLRICICFVLLAECICFVLLAEVVTIFSSKMVRICARNTNIHKT